MLVGGLSAVLLQSLHPLAMAGVAEHSNWWEAPLVRLSRTSSFVVATTYGSTPVAESVIAAVRAVHARVVGTAPDGRPYAAGDPALLTWVHTAEVWSFLAAYQRYQLAPREAPRPTGTSTRWPSRVRGRLGLRQLPGLEWALLRPAPWSLLHSIRLAVGPPPALLQARARGAAGALG